MDDATFTRNKKCTIQTSHQPRCFHLDETLGLGLFPASRGSIIFSRRSSIMFTMSPLKLHRYKWGVLLTSSNQGLLHLSSMKSNPKYWKRPSWRYELIAFIVCCTAMDTRSNTCREYILSQQCYSRKLQPHFEITCHISHAKTGIDMSSQQRINGVTMLECLLWNVLCTKSTNIYPWHKHIGHAIKTQYLNKQTFHNPLSQFNIRCIVFLGAMTITLDFSFMFIYSLMHMPDRSISESWNTFI